MNKIIRIITAPYLYQGRNRIGMPFRARGFMSVIKFNENNDIGISFTENTTCNAWFYLSDSFINEVFILWVTATHFINEKWLPLMTSVYDRTAQHMHKLDMSEC